MNAQDLHDQIDRIACHVEGDWSGFAATGETLAREWRALADSVLEGAPTAGEPPAGAGIATHERRKADEGEQMSVLGCLSSETLSATELAGRARMPVRIVSDALRRLIKAGTVEQVGVKRGARYRVAAKQAETEEP